MSEGILPPEVEEKIIELSDGFCDNPNVGDVQDELITFYNESVAAEREALTNWMLQHSFANGNADTTEELLKELEWQVEEIRQGREKAKKEAFDLINANSILSNGVIDLRAKVAKLEAMLPRKLSDEDDSSVEPFV